MKEIRSLIQSDALGRGAYLTTEMTVDNTAPVVSDVWKNLENGNLKFTVRDNQYLAMVQVTDHNGNVLGEVSLDGQEAGKPYTGGSGSDRCDRWPGVLHCGGRLCQKSDHLPGAIRRSVPG